MFRKRIMSRKIASEQSVSNTDIPTKQEIEPITLAVNKLKSAIMQLNPKQMKHVQDDYMFRNEFNYVLGLLKWDGVDNWNQSSPDIAREMLRNN